MCVCNCVRMYVGRIDEGKLIKSFSLKEICVDDVRACVF